MNAFPRFIYLRLWSALAWIAILFAFGSAPAIAESQGQAMAIPGYFSLDNNPNIPTNPHGHDDWINLLTAQAVAKIVVLDMSVLGNGSGLNDCTQTPARMIDCLHANGTLVLGYVNAGAVNDAGTGCRTQAEILNRNNDTNHAGVGDWFPAFNVDGIFFDNVAPDDRIPACFVQNNYETIFSNVHRNHLSNGAGPDMCNGRACIMINASQYPQRWTLDSTFDSGFGHADFATTYERPTSGAQYSQACNATDGQSYFGKSQLEPSGFCPKTGLNDNLSNCTGDAMNPVNWFFSTDYGPKTAHILRQNSTAAPTDFNAVIALSQTRHAGYLYIGDQMCNLSNGTQYGHLTGYYAALKASLGGRLTIDRTNASTNTGTGSVTSVGNGIKCDGSNTEKCDNLIAKNTRLRLTAQAGANSSFGGFVDGNNSSLCGGANLCDVTLTADMTVRAVFSGNPPPGVALTANKAGSGAGTVTSSPQGISCGPSCTSVAFSFASGSIVTLTATPDANSRFVSFSSNCAPVSGNPTQCTITMSTPATVTTTFTATKPLTVSKTGTGTGTVTSSPAGISCGGTSCASVTQSFDSGTTVTLTATPDAGSNFTAFSSNCAPVSGVPTQCTILMSAAATVTANFMGTTPKFWLTVSKGGTGAGTVTSNPAGISCGPTCASASFQFTQGLTVTLAATAETNSSFTSFGSNCTPVSGNPTQCTITMSADATVITNFTVTKFPLTVSKAGTGTGTVTSSPAGISCGPTCANANSLFNTGTTVTLTAAPGANSTFAGFSSNCAPVTGSPTQCTIVMSAAATVTTTFAGTNVVPVVPPLFSDNFGRTTGLGADWHVWYGAYTTDGSAAISGTPPINGNWASVVPSMRTNDYAVVSDIVIPSGSLYSGVVARGSPSVFDENLYAAQLSTDGNVYLYRRNNWNWTALGTTSAGITANTSYTLKLLVKGSNPVHLEVWLGGALQIELDDASASRITSGVPGIENYDPNVRYSSFAVYPAPLFDDNFKRTTGLGANWSVPIGSYTTDGAAAVSGAPPVGGNWAKVNASLGTNDYVVTSDVVVPAGSLFSGIVARGGVNFGDDEYAQQISTDGNVYLYRRNVGTWTVLGSAAAGITAGTTYSLKLVVSGSNPVHLEAWLNGALQIVVDDTSASRLQSGAPGIENYDANVRYSSFAVYAGPVFADRFSRTTGLGSAWVTDNGTYTADGSGAVSGAPPVQGNWAHITTPPSTANYAVEADLTIVTGSQFSGIVGRSAVANQFTSDVYAAQISTDGAIYLYRRNGWTWTTLTSTPAGIVAGVRYTLKLVAVGADPVHLEAWLDGSKRLQFDDSSTSQLRTGGVGIENYDAGVRYGSFSVYPR